MNYTDELLSKLAVKSLGDEHIEGYACLWSNGDAKDLDGDYFHKEDTKDLLLAFKALGKLPWLFEHGADPKTKGVPIALIEEMEPDEIGLHYKAKIEQHELYRKYVERLVKEGKLYSSSGAYPRTAKGYKNGKIAEWVIAEVSGTVAPIDYRQLELGEIETITKHFDFGETLDIEEDSTGAEDARLNLVLSQTQLELEKDLLILTGELL